MAGNANSGRRPHPTRLRVLRGNPSKSPLNPREPQPPSGPVQKPLTLSVGAGAIWDRVAPICLAMGTLTVADVDAFGALCELQATLQLASAYKDRKQFRVISRAGLPHPAVKVERETATALRPYYEKFGLDPIGRARIVLPVTADAPASKWAGVLP